MTMTERLHHEALDRLDAARHAVLRMASASEDSVARLNLEAEFDHVEDAVREFGRCQLLLNPQNVTRQFAG